MSQGPTQDDLKKARDAEMQLAWQLVWEVDAVLRFLHGNVPFWAERLAFLSERRREAAIAIGLIQDALTKISFVEIDHPITSDDVVKIGESQRVVNNGEEIEISLYDRMPGDDIQEHAAQKGDQHE